MKIVPKNRPAELVEPPLSEARTRRMWEAVDGRIHPTTSRRTPWLLAAATATCVAAAFVLVGLRPEPKVATTTTVQRAAVVVTSTESDRIMSFTGGSTVALEPKTQLTMLENGPKIRLRLERGGVNCTVSQSGSPLVIEAAHVVTTLGPGVHRVRIGERRSPVVETLSGSASLQAEAAPPVVLEAGERWSEVGITRVAGWVSSDETTPGTEAPTPPPKLVPSATTGDARSLFARAESARLEGRSAVAAHGFDELYRTFPRDERAAIAALEASRLHLRITGDLVAALAASSFARTHARDPFREDAHAVQIEVLERLGRTAECRAARDTFIATYPSSPHHEKVTARCD